jgi:hypothetical protein
VVDALTLEPHLAAGVIATINLALAILTEATLSFLGVGLPPTEPSLGTLIRIGNNFLMSGEYCLAEPGWPSLPTAPRQLTCRET